MISTGNSSYQSRNRHVPVAAAGCCAPWSLSLTAQCMKYLGRTRTTRMRSKSEPGTCTSPHCHHFLTATPSARSTTTRASDFELATLYTPDDLSVSLASAPGGRPARYTWWWWVQGPQACWQHITSPRGDTLLMSMTRQPGQWPTANIPES